MFNVRLYQHNDFEMLDSWWKSQGIQNFSPDFMSDSSFIVENNKRPIAAVSLHLTNIAGYTHVENLIGNPEFKGEERKEAINFLQIFIETYAQNLGYKKLMCMTNNNKIKQRYIDLGYTPTLEGVTTFIKEL